jgi:hypothetical protein
MEAGSWQLAVIPASVCASDSCRSRAPRHGGGPLCTCHKFSSPTLELSLSYDSHNSSPRQIPRRKLQSDRVADEHPDEGPARSARRVCRDLPLPIDHHPIQAARQRFRHGADYRPRAVVPRVVFSIAGVSRPLTHTLLPPLRASRAPSRCARTGGLDPLSRRCNRSPNAARGPGQHQRPVLRHRHGVLEMG